MFSDQEHLFFSTKGHNGNDINLVVQNPARLDLVIREMTDTFFYVKKIEIPLIWRPLLFVLDAYLCEDDFKRRHMDKDALYNLSYKLFRPKVSKAYDTHYFRKECDQEPVFISWDEKLGLDNPLNRVEKSRFKTAYEWVCMG